MTADAAAPLFILHLRFPSESSRGVNPLAEFSSCKSLCAFTSPIAAYPRRPHPQHRAVCSQPADVLFPGFVCAKHDIRFTLQ